MRTRMVAAVVLSAAFASCAKKDSSGVKSDGSASTSTNVDPLGIFVDQVMTGEGGNLVSEKGNIKAGSLDSPLDRRVAALVPSCSGGDLDSLFSKAQMSLVNSAADAGRYRGNLQFSGHQFDANRDDLAAEQVQGMVMAVILEGAAGIAEQELQKNALDLRSLVDCVKSDRCPDVIEEVEKVVAGLERQRASQIPGSASTPIAALAGREVDMRLAENGAVDLSFPIRNYISTVNYRSDPKREVSAALSKIQEQVDSQLRTIRSGSYTDLLYHPMAIGSALEEFIGANFTGAESLYADEGLSALFAGTYCHIVSLAYQGFDKAAARRDSWKNVLLVGASIAALPLGPLAAAVVGMGLASVDAHIQYAKIKNDLFHCTIGSDPGLHSDEDRDCESSESLITAGGALAMMIDVVPAVGRIGGGVYRLAKAKPGRAGKGGRKDSGCPPGQGLALAGGCAYGNPQHAKIDGHSVSRENPFTKSYSGFGVRKPFNLTKVEGSNEAVVLIPVRMQYAMAQKILKDLDIPQEGNLKQLLLRARTLMAKEFDEAVESTGGVVNATAGTTAKRIAFEKPPELQSVEIAGVNRQGQWNRVCYYESFAGESWSTNHKDCKKVTLVPQ